MDTEGRILTNEWEKDGGRVEGELKAVDPLIAKMDAASVKLYFMDDEIKSFSFLLLFISDSR